MGKGQVLRSFKPCQGERAFWDQKEPCKGLLAMMVQTTQALY